MADQDASGAPPPRRRTPRREPAAATPARAGRQRGEQAEMARRLNDRRERLAHAINAYDPTVTYIDLIRKNKRASVALIALMLLLSVLVGSVIGGAIGPVATGWGRIGSSWGAMYEADDVIGSMTDTDAAARHDAAGREFSRSRLRAFGADTSLFRDASVFVPSMALGGVIAFLLAVGVTVWSFYGGSKAILRISGAVPIDHTADPELFNVVDEMRIAAGLPMPAVYIIPETALNAFATGRDPEHAAVAITTGLRERLTRDELQGVMAHEMAHIRHYDIRFALLMATLAGLIVFVCDAFLTFTRYHFWFGSGRRSGGGKHNGQMAIIAVVLMVVALLLALIAPLVARLIQMGYSRQREYLADAGAVELTRNPEALAAALDQLDQDPEPLVEAANRGTAHLFITNPLRKTRRERRRGSRWFASHPPIADRIARLLALLR